MGMRFDDMVKTAHEALEHGKCEDAQVMALLAIADRLDRLCALQSGGGEKPYAVRYTCSTGSSAAPPRW